MKKIIIAISAILGIVAVIALIAKNSRTEEI